MRVFIMKKETLFKIAACTIMLIAAIIYTVSAFNDETEAVFNDSGLCMTDIKSADSAVALTFDTAFGEDRTKEILSVLKDKGVKATFAVMGTWAEENPRLVEKMIDEGHQIISHSMTHERYNELGPEGALKDAMAAKELLKMDHGIDTNYIRTPYGSGGEDVYTILAENGFTPVGWSVDSQDWKEDGAENIADRVLNNAENGSIIVMQNNNQQTVEALPMIIDGLLEINLECVSLDELGGER